LKRERRSGRHNSRAKDAVKELDLLSPACKSRCGKCLKASSMRLRKGTRPTTTGRGESSAFQWCLKIPGVVSVARARRQKLRVSTATIAPIWPVRRFGIDPTRFSSEFYPAKERRCCRVGSAILRNGLCVAADQMTAASKDERGGSFRADHKVKVERRRRQTTVDRAA